MIGTGHISFDMFNPVCSILMEIGCTAVFLSKSSFLEHDLYVIVSIQIPNMLNWLFYCSYAPLATEVANNQQMTAKKNNPS